MYARGIWCMYPPHLSMWYVTFSLKKPKMFNDVFHIVLARDKERYQPLSYHQPSNSLADKRPSQGVEVSLLDACPLMITRCCHCLSINPYIPHSVYRVYSNHLSYLFNFFKHQTKGKTK